MSAGIVLGILVALLPLALHGSIFFPTRERTTGVIASYDYLGSEVSKGTRNNSKSMMSITFYVFGEIFLLIIPALIIAFVAYYFSIKKREKLYKF